MPGTPTAPQREFPIPHEPVTHESGRHHVLTCRACGEHFVRIVAVQVAALADERMRDGSRRLDHVTVWTADGDFALDEPVTPGHDAANNRRPRVALTFACDRCGATWAAVLTHHQGQSFGYVNERPTATAKRAR